MNVSLPQLYSDLIDHLHQLQQVSPGLADNIHNIITRHFGEDVEHTTFTHEGHVIVATDGSTKQETSLASPSGSACAFTLSEQSRLNCSESLPYEIGAINIHVAETLALLLAIRTARNNAIPKIHILSDSLNCSKRFKELQGNSWDQTIIKEESYCPEEEQLWLRISWEISEMESVRISHIRSHVSDEGNIPAKLNGIADTLAKACMEAQRQQIRSDAGQPLLRS